MCIHVCSKYSSVYMLGKPPHRKGGVFDISICTCIHTQTCACIMYMQIYLSADMYMYMYMNIYIFMCIFENKCIYSSAYV